VTSLEVIRWWEIRRIYYNAALLAIGLAALAFMMWFTNGIFLFLGDGIGSVGLTAGILLYGLAANACYTLGWILELQEHGDNPAQARARAEQRYRLGFRFSALLTTAPFCFGIFLWATACTHIANISARAALALYHSHAGGIACPHLYLLLPKH
jgi:hypothetical protein